jgi:hypothetical protein
MLRPWIRSVSASSFVPSGSAFHAPSRTVLVVEIKTVVPDFQAMVASIDRTSRLAVQIAKEHGWAGRTVGRILVIGDGSIARDRVARLDASVRTIVPDRGPTVRKWLRTPDGPLSGLQFFRNAIPGSTTRRRAGLERVGRRRSDRNATEPGVPDAARSRSPGTQA